VSRFRERAQLQRPIPANQLIEPSVLAKIGNITVGDTVSVLQFIQKFGTHYINSYVTGNSLYQVSEKNKVLGRF
jgi:torso-like protein